MKPEENLIKSSSKTRDFLSMKHKGSGTEDERSEVLSFIGGCAEALDAKGK
jgi:hypothetical protein